MNCDTLNSTSPYQIKGERGTWYYSYQTDKSRERKYFVWRKAANNNWKVTINLNKVQVQRKVSEM